MGIGVGRIDSSANWIRLQIGKIWGLLNSGKKAQDSGLKAEDTSIVESLAGSHFRWKGNDLSFGPARVFPLCKGKEQRV